MNRILIISFTLFAGFSCGITETSDDLTGKFQDELTQDSQCEQPGACGPVLGLPTPVCTDGTAPGPNRCLLNKRLDKCVWKIAKCPSKADAGSVSGPNDEANGNSDGGTAGACTKEECGIIAGSPNYVCADGTIGGPVCLRNPINHICGYIIRQCAQQP